MSIVKYVYFYGFGKESTEGNATMKSLLGGKGANLAEMANENRFVVMISRPIPRLAR